MLTRFCCAVTLALPLFTGGCNQASGPGVNGSITYNRTLVADGFITFSPTGGGSSFGAKIVDGKYAAEQASAGQFKILVSGTAAASEVIRSREQAAQQVQESGGQAIESPAAIPETAAGNGQTVEVKDGEQTLDFALSDPAGQ